MEAKPKQIFVVARETWIRGKLALDAHGNNQSSLLDSDGRRCCLGFVANQLGIRDSALIHEPDPSCISGADEAEDNLLFRAAYSDEDYVRVINTPLSDTAITHNDDTEIADHEREAKLQETFAGYGYAIEFVDTQAQLEARLAELRATPLQHGEKGPGR